MQRYWIFGLISVMIIALDQVTKSIIVSCVSGNDSLNVLPGLLNIVHVRNPGAAFGIMSEDNGYLSKIFLVGVSLAALIIVLCLVARTREHDRYHITAYAFFFAGAAGNLIDRLRYGEVIDFIDVYVGQYHWPAFNVADSALCAGAGLLMLHSIRGSFGNPDA